MNLAECEITEGAKRLARTCLKVEDWDGLEENKKAALRVIVKGLAETIKQERTPAAVFVFLKWMGD